MSTNVDQYKNAPVYSVPKKLDTGKTFHNDQAISYNNKAKGETVSECHPINSGK